MQDAAVLAPAESEVLNTLTPSLLLCSTLTKPGSESVNIAVNGCYYP